MSIDNNEIDKTAPQIMDLQTSVDPSADNSYDPLSEILPGEIIPEDEQEVKKDKVEDEVKGLPKQNIGEVVTPFKDGTIKGMDSVPLPSDTYKAVEDMIADLPAVDVADDDIWTANLRNGYENEVYQGTGYDRFAQKDGLFTNLLKTDNGVNLTGVYAGTQKNSNAVLTGERAVLAMMNYMRVGNIFMAPLWNSGFWVSVKPPTEGAVIDLMHLLRAEKVRTGRATHGLAYSSTTGVTAKYVVEFVKAHIYSTSINAKEVSVSDIEKYILVSDLDSLLISIICSMYPNGFNYSRSCVADPVVCNHVVDAVVDPSKLLFVNRQALTEAMLGHMSNRRTGSMQLKDVQSYQTQMAARNIRVLDYVADADRALRFELKTPTIDKYILSTDSWISEIETTADRVLAKDATDRERAILIDRHSKATTMRQYMHYVDSITYGDNNMVKDRRSIEMVLSTMSSDTDLSVAFNKAVTELINTSTVATIGIPTYDCPKCHKPVRSRQQMPEEYQNIIPLDILSIFFDLVRVKMVQINQR